MNYLSVVGARPNFIKLAAVHRAFTFGNLIHRIVHTGQHYDFEMAEQFFRDLAIPKPDVDLGVGSGSHGQQTGLLMARLEECFMQESPDLVITYGDVNSTMAAALVAAKMGIRTAHVEAGFRSFDRTMPEEINRIVADVVSDLLFTVDEVSRQNLLKEGIPDEKIHVVGNTMIDTVMAHESAIDDSRILDALAISDGEFAVLTLHRPSNVDTSSTLEKLIRLFGNLSRELPIVFPIHPRTKKRLAEFGLDAVVRNGRFVITPPLGYIDFLKVVKHARLVASDSGGIQDEALYFGTPMMTLRDRTEKLYTTEGGRNRIVGNDTNLILQTWRELIQSPPAPSSTFPGSDGKAAERIRLRCQTP